MADFPSMEAELGYAVARGRIPLALADVSILARYKDLDEARQRAADMRRSIAVWQHIRSALETRVRDEVRANMRARAAKNVILAKAHDVNASQTLDEDQVTGIVLDEVWRNLPDAPRRRYVR